MFILTHACNAKMETFQLMYCILNYITVPQLLSGTMIHRTFKLVQYNFLILGLGSNIPFVFENLGQVIKVLVLGIVVQIDVEQGEIM